MSDRIKTGVYSETSNLEAVILHTPGPEVENMTPLNAERALYSDILNLSVAKKEYSQLSCLLGKFTRTLYVEDLLRDILEQDEIKEKLIRKICMKEDVAFIIDELMMLDAAELSRQLIQGVPLRRERLTSYLSKENYSLRPLHNFFFTRDSSVALYDHILIARMAAKVRDRESIIMQEIFDNHPQFSATTLNPQETPAFNDKIKIEGGDILIARDDIILVGIGSRTSPEGVDFILDHLMSKKDERHIIVQELPLKPESFIHLDMTFTFLDSNSCLIYEPLITRPNRYETVHIHLDGGGVKSISSVKSIPDVLNDLGMDLELIYCGGRKDPLSQEREQWHSGANLFALGPGRLIGYSRNVHTLEDLSNNGYDIYKAKDVISGKVNPESSSRFLIAIDGSELARGGGGVRCMTMPVRRTFTYTDRADN